MAWAQMLAVLVGLWLMMAPAVLNYPDPARTNDFIIGPLVVSFAFIALWEATRGIRWLNVIAAEWLLLAPLFLAYTGTATFNSLACGFLILVLTPWVPPMKSRIGGGWSAIWRRQ